MESFSVIWCSFLLVNVQFFVWKVDATITWTLPSPQRGPLSASDGTARTTLKVFDGRSPELRLEWDFTLDGVVLSFVAWNIGTTVNIGSKAPSGAVTVLPAFQGQFNISPNDRATLIIYNTTAADGEKITCRVVAGMNIWEDVILVVIKVPANITEIRGEQTVHEGGNLLLTCEASGKPEPNITWTKEKRGNEGNTGVLPVGKVLNITKISRNDSGTFNCTAYNGFGEADSQTVHVTVTYPPKIVKFKTEYFVGVQERVTLKCEAEGNPPSTYIWIPCDTEQVCDKNALHISQVLSDTNYTCRVANVHGNDSKTANVYIGGNVINITIVNISEICTGGKYKSSLLLEKFEELLKDAFADKSGYEGVQLKCVRCESRVAVLALQFNSSTKERDVIITLNDTVKDGKLGEFSVGAIKGERPDVKTTCEGTKTQLDDSTGGIAWWIILIIVLAVVIVLVLLVILLKKTGRCPPLSVKNGKHPRVHSDEGRGIATEADNQYAAAGPNVNYRASNPSSEPSVTYEVANRSSEGRRGNKAGAPKEPLPEYAVVDKTKKKKKTPKPGELQYAELGELTGRGQKATMPRVSGTDTVYADIKS
ncbi:unnamed protein product [Pocillopora meandrina]|uniref:Ig-like domain-containing protein n=1 Tax=Pocillopora meandrina TaxID=46732 RepID=A0AAU9XY29_9CNID|nr:unnamed protein product [Pocillopora meandrina]